MNNTSISRQKFQNFHKSDQDLKLRAT